MFTYTFLGCLGDPENFENPEKLRNHLGDPNNPEIYKR